MSDPLKKYDKECVDVAEMRGGKDMPRRIKCRGVSLIGIDFCYAPYKVRSKILSSFILVICSKISKRFSKLLYINSWTNKI